MPRTPNNKASAPTLAPDAARASFQVVEPALASVSDDKIIPLPAQPAEVKHALVTALQVAELLSDPEVQTRFGLLPRSLFEPATVGTFIHAVGAVWHCRNELDAATAAQGEVTLPEPLAVKAHELRHRMLRVVTHYFEDDDKRAPEIKPIGRKKGHRALVSDLQKLAEIYDAEKAMIERDPKHYRATDVSDARAVATEVAAALESARGEAEKSWNDRLVRAFTLMLHTYEEVQAAGMFLFRREGAGERFPGIHTARKARGPKGRKDDAGAEDPAVGTIEPVAPEAQPAQGSEEAHGDA